MSDVAEKLREVAGALERGAPIAVEDRRIIAAALAVLDLTGRPGSPRDRPGRRR
jgi:hypothetical protein